MDPYNTGYSSHASYGAGSPPPAYGDPYGATSTAAPPRMYINDGGITRINPRYKEYLQINTDSPDYAVATTAHPKQAMAVVSNMEQYIQYSQVSETAGYGSIPLAPDTHTMFHEKIYDQEGCDTVGLASNALIKELGNIFAKHEIPIGLLHRLQVLSNYDYLEFIIDDSGSMNSKSDTKDAKGRTQTRWDEAHSRLKQLVEILAYVPCAPIKIRFLNRVDVVSLEHSGQCPDDFLAYAYTEIDTAFRRLPVRTDLTPVRDCLETSFRRGKGKRVSRYLFGDGQPNGGVSARSEIENLFLLPRMSEKKRKSLREANPMAFLSCTNLDNQVQWMKDLEAVALFCSEYDDFLAESDEISQEQGYALPFTRGFHLIGQLVAAMFPEDLDAMDEPIPFTKYALDNLLGIVHSEGDYRHYFNELKAAQGRRGKKTSVDRLIRRTHWERAYHEFLNEPSARKIPMVKKFIKAREKAALKDRHRH